MAYWLNGYDRQETQYLIHGFTYGFSLQYEGNRESQAAKNLKSAIEHPDVVSKKLQKELAAGHIAGPFDCPPPNLKISPLGVVPKKTPNEFRLIHHLSYSEKGHDGSSVNEGIPREECRVQYATVDEAVQKIKKLGGNPWLFKVDIRNTFRIIPVRPEDYMLLGFQWQGKYYFDRRLPMGCSISCRVFTSLSRALVWIMINKLGASDMAFLLDDFLGMEVSQQNCQHILSKFLWLCQTLGIPIATEKTLGPSQCLVFLGLTLDTIKAEIRLPMDKIEHCIQLLHHFRRKKSAKLKEIQSLTGLLSFCCTAIQGGRAFTRRLIALTMGVTVEHHHVKLNAAARADLAVWLQFLQHFNGRSMFLHEQWLSSQKVRLYTDSAGSLGYGAIYRSYWLYGPFPDKWKNLNITFLELYPIVLAVNVWGHLMQNHSILFTTDNEALVYIINKQSSKDALIMTGIRKLVAACLKFNIRFKATHISSAANYLSDHLSRLQVDQFRAKATWCRENPTVVPANLLPENFLAQ